MECNVQAFFFFLVTLRSLIDGIRNVIYIYRYYNYFTRFSEKEFLYPPLDSRFFCPPPFSKNPGSAPARAVHSSE